MDGQTDGRALFGDAIRRKLSFGHTVLAISTHLSDDSFHTPKANSFAGPRGIICAQDAGDLLPRLCPDNR